MHQWEYLFVECEGGLINYEASNHKPRYVNGRELPNWKSGNLYEFTIQMGKQGWELASFAYGSNVPHSLLIFKRPMQ